MGVSAREANNQVAARLRTRDRKRRTTVLAHVEFIEMRQLMDGSPK